MKRNKSMEKHGKQWDKWCKVTSFISENLRRRRSCEFCGAFFHYLYLMNNVTKILVEFTASKIVICKDERKCRRLWREKKNFVIRYRNGPIRRNLKTQTWLVFEIFCKYFHVTRKATLVSMKKIMYYLLSSLYSGYREENEWSPWLISKFLLAKE